MKHGLEGKLLFNERTTDFSGGKGYLEKDWGTSFPKYYSLIQSNHFQNDSTAFFSTAHIQLYGREYEGFICILLLEGKEYRFTTYIMSRMKILEVSENHCPIHLDNQQAQLEISATIMS